MKTSISKRAIITALGIAAAIGIPMALGQIQESAEIERVADEYRQAWQRGDLDAVMQHWTPDAKSIGPGGVASGTNAIRLSLEGSLKMGIYDLRHEDREVYGGGASAVEVTRSVLYDRTGKRILTAREMTLWQKSGGKWRIHRDFVIPFPEPQAQ